MTRGPPHAPLRVDARPGAADPRLRSDGRRPGRRGLRRPRRARERVSVVVPGVDTDLLTFEKSDRPYSAPVGMARALQRPAARRGTRRPTATVAWADYTAPTGLGVEAASGEPRRGRRGAAHRLRPRAARRPPRVSLFCHSYGSVVCGDAAAELPDVSPTSPSPAAPGCARDAAQTSAPAPASGRCATATTGSRTSRTWRSAGSATVPTPSPPPSAPAASPPPAPIGHTGYFVPGTGSLDNFAAIATGSYSAVDCAPATGASAPRTAASSDSAVHSVPGCR